MADSGMFFTIILFMFIFNGLVAVYAISDTNIPGNIDDMPTIDEQPGLLDYLKYPFQWVFYVGKLVFFTIAELPVWLVGIVVALDLTLAYIIIAMVRGN